MRLMEKPHPLFSQASEPRCRTCGFALTGLPDVGECPECGRLYNSANSVAFDPPSLGRALGHLALPLAPAFLVIAVGLDLLSRDRGSGGYFAFGLPWIIGGVACVIWASVRATRFLRALANTQPPRQEGASTRMFLSRAGMSIAILITVVAGLVCLLLSLAFMFCLGTLGR